MSPTPRTTAHDVRQVTTLVVRQALERAGTIVCEPLLRVTVEAPAESLGILLPFLASVGASMQAPSFAHDLAVIDALMPPSGVRELSRQLAPLTSGEGAMESAFAGYRPR